MNPLDWQNLIFIIPIGVGIMILIGSMFGLVDLDGDFDVDADDFDGKGASLLDFGRVPFTILLLMATMIFGVTGFVGNVILHAYFPELFYFWFSLGAALFSMVFFTGRLSRLMAKHMPSTETYNVSKESLIGCMGSLIGGANEAMGVMDVSDKEGNVHRVLCRTQHGVSFTGDKTVLIIDYNQDGDYYIVDAA